MGWRCCLGEACRTGEGPARIWPEWLLWLLFPCEVGVDCVLMDGSDPDDEFLPPNNRPPFAPPPGVAGCWDRSGGLGAFLTLLFFRLFRRPLLTVLCCLPFPVNAGFFGGGIGAAAAAAEDDCGWSFMLPSPRVLTGVGGLLRRRGERLETRLRGEGGAFLLPLRFPPNILRSLGACCCCCCCCGCCCGVVFVNPAEPPTSSF